jgi:aminocarboxymuconate-semialdehyde decarboxylase
VRPESRRPLAPPSHYLTRFTFDTITHDARALGYLIGLVGADHVAYGTDFPFDMAAGTLEVQLGDLQLTKHDRRLVADGTAARLLDLAPLGA